MCIGARGATVPRTHHVLSLLVYVGSVTLKSNVIFEQNVSVLTHRGIHENIGFVQMFLLYQVNGFPVALFEFCSNVVLCFFQKQCHICSNYAYNRYQTTVSRTTHA